MIPYQYACMVRLNHYDWARFPPGFPEAAWNLSQNIRKPGQNKKFSRKSGMFKRYTTFQYYVEMIFPKFFTPAILECIWHLPLWPSYLHFNLNNDLLKLCTNWIGGTFQNLANHQWPGPGCNFYDIFNQIGLTWSIIVQEQTDLMGGLSGLWWSF